MILKLFGLPLTGTDLVKYMVENYAQERVTVWHHRPGFEDCLYHKHGAPRVTPGADGYLLCTRPFDKWLAAMQAKTPRLSKSDARTIYTDWYAQIPALAREQKALVVSTEWETDPRETLERLCAVFSLTIKPVTVTLPTVRLSRGVLSPPAVEKRSKR